MEKAGIAFLLLVVVALFVVGPGAICSILAAFVVLAVLAFIVNLFGF